MRESNGNKRNAVFIVHGSRLFGWVQRAGGGKPPMSDDGLKKIDDEIRGIDIRGIRANDRSKPDHLVYITKN